ncbi:MAG: sel1 repeat family protein, partial [Synergistaceae bacterium]|nr:sel1 repeat family protein [Synergistaceae bacterium]
MQAQSQNALALYEQGMKYYGAGNYDEAVSCFHEAAELGNAEAQYRLGKMYTVGDKVKQDWKEVAKWYRRAAEQGHIEAQET